MKSVDYCTVVLYKLQWDCWNFTYLTVNGVSMTPTLLLNLRAQSIIMPLKRLLISVRSCFAALTCLYRRRSTSSSSSSTGRDDNVTSSTTSPPLPADDVAVTKATSHHPPSSSATASLASRQLRAPSSRQQQQQQGETSSVQRPDVNDEEQVLEMLPGLATCWGDHRERVANCSQEVAILTCWSDIGALVYRHMIGECGYMFEEFATLPDHQIQLPREPSAWCNLLWM